MRKWKWMAGMRTKSRVRVVEVEDDGYTTGFFEKHGYVLEVAEDVGPDWEDPATLGCLLHQVREARGEPTYRPYALLEGGEVVWTIEKPGLVRQTRYGSEAEALLAALEEAE